MQLRQKVTVAMASAAVATLLLVAPAQAATTQQGLVNVNATDVTVQIPVSAAANVCGLNVLVLVQGLANGPVACRAGSISLATSDGDDAGPVDQSGLINVNLQNVNAQVPVDIAANICGTTVDVLSANLANGPVNCQAFGRSAAVSA